MSPSTSGYLAKSGSGPGVLVLHAWWGLNDTFKSMCDRLSEKGYVVYAPDLYHGATATTIEEAERLSGGLNFETAIAEARAAVDALFEHGADRSRGIAVIGFSLGAYYAVQLSGMRPDAVDKAVLFYGAGEGDYAVSRAAYLGHFAEDDPFESAEWIEKMGADMQAAGRSVTFHTYPGVGHWFCEPDRVDHYNAEAAALAWERTLAFLS